LALTNKLLLIDETRHNARDNRLGKPEPNPSHRQIHRKRLYRVHDELMSSNEGSQKNPVPHALAHAFPLVAVSKDHGKKDGVQELSPEKPGAEAMHAALGTPERRCGLVHRL